MLVGIPGSGKTRAATTLEAAGFLRISQDQLGNRKKCEAAVAAALKAGRSVVVDRCNADASQRLTWATLANAARVRAVALELTPPLEQCLERATARDDHPTLSKEEAPGVVRKFAADFVAVDRRREGFSAVLRASEDADADAVVAALGNAPTDGPARADLESWEWKGVEAAQVEIQLQQQQRQQELREKQLRRGGGGGGSGGRGGGGGAWVGGGGRGGPPHMRGPLPPHQMQWQPQQWQPRPHWQQQQQMRGVGGGRGGGGFNRGPLPPQQQQPRRPFQGAPPPGPLAQQQFAPGAPVPPPPPPSQQQPPLADGSGLPSPSSGEDGSAQVVIGGAGGLPVFGLGVGVVGPPLMTATAAAPSSGIAEAGAVSAPGAAPLGRA